MDLNAIELAGERLEWAEEALADLRAAKAAPAAEKAWTEFLLAASAFFSKLEQGAKVNSKSNYWFGTKVKQRKDDPVLRYIKAARNSDEHGIERVTERADAGWNRALAGPGLKFNQQFKSKMQMVNKETGKPEGPETTVFLYAHYLKAITAHDRRFNDTCDPPVGLLDDRDGSYPPDIAEVVLEKLRDILEEAAALV